LQAPLADYVPLTITVNDSYLPDPIELLAESTHVRRASQRTDVALGRAAPHSALLPAAAVTAAAEAKAADDADALSLAGTMTTLSTVSEGEMERRLLEMDVDLSLMQRLRRPSRKLPAALTAMVPLAAVAVAAAADDDQSVHGSVVTDEEGLETPPVPDSPITGREAILQALADHEAASRPVLPAGAVFAPEIDPSTDFFRVVSDPAERAVAPAHWQHLSKPEYVRVPTYAEHVKHQYNSYRVRNGLVPIVNYDLGAFSDDLDSRVLPDGRRYLDVAMLL
jgi:hypothetical protein